MIQTDNLPPVALPADSVAAAHDMSAGLSSLKGLSLEEVVSLLVERLVHFSLSIVAAVAVFYIGRFIVRKIYALTESILLRRHVEQSLTTFVLSLVNIVLYFILAVTVIGILGLETSSFLAIFASAGVAVGMALSGTLQNFAGGVLILLLKPFRVGHYIEAQGFAGTVKRIEIFNTIITTPDNKTIIIPNGGLSTGTINNSTAQTSRRVEWKLGISYGDSPAAARAAILEMLAADPRVLTTATGAQADPAVYVASLDDSAVSLSVRAWVSSGDYWDVFFHFNELFYTDLPSRAGINFPFPQMDVHISHTDSPAGGASSAD